MSFVMRVLVNGVAIWLATLVLPGLTVVGGDGGLERAGVVLLVALVFGVVNAVVKPVVRFFAAPLYILTLGLFTLVVNALMLMLTAWVTERASWGLRVEDFWTALLGGLIIAVVSFVLSVVVPRRRD